MCAVTGFAMDTASSTTPKPPPNEATADDVRVLINTVYSGLEERKNFVVIDVTPILVQGKAEDPARYKKLVSALSGFTNVQNLSALETAPSSDADNDTNAKKLNVALDDYKFGDKGYFHVNATYISQLKAIELTGVLLAISERRGAEELANDLMKQLNFKLPLINHIRVLPPIVEIEAHFLRVSSQRLENIGLNILGPNGIGIVNTASFEFKNFQFLPHLHPGTGTLSNETKIPDKASSTQLNINREDLRVQEIAAPFLTTLSHDVEDITFKPAMFHQGGETGSLIATDSVTSISYRPFGVYLNVDPTVLQSGEVNCEVTVEISAPLNVPGINVQNSISYTKKFRGDPRRKVDGPVWSQQ